jgi:hypothetical protein
MRIKALWAGTALVSSLAAMPAFAITPDEVWKSFQELSTSYGQTLTSESVAEDGGNIVVTGLSIVQEEEGARVEGRVEEITFTDNGDGTVSVTMSETFPMTMTVPGEDGNPVTIGMTFSQPGLKITASGEAANAKYDFVAPEMTLALESIEGVDAEAVNVTAEAKLANLVGSYLFAGPAEMRTLDSSFTADSINVTIAGTSTDPSPAEGEAAAPSQFNAVIGMADLAGSTKGTILSSAMMQDFQAALAAGFETQAGFTAGATTYNFDITEATGQTKIAGTGESSSLNVAIGKDSFNYGGGAKNVAMTMTVPDLPFPDMKLSYAEAAFNLLVPVAQTEAPADFAFLTKLVDVTISDELWGIFDPAAVLPREPATIVIDTKGKARVTADLSDAEAMAEGAVPGELHALDVTELRAKVAGAELTGTGAFTFDNTDLVTFGGMPAPTGKLDLKLTGGNGLMQKLVTLGFISEEDMMGANMMLSMFANPGPGEDELNSTLEFKDKGFYANGQRLQ